MLTDDYLAIRVPHRLPHGGAMMPAVRPMNDLIRQNFGLLIAYILPGFVVVSGAALIYPSVRLLIMPTLGLADGVESTAFVALATLLAGMFVSALRWLLVDTLHHVTGLRRPEWDDAKLPARLPAFSAIVEDHYRFYQFHSNLAVAIAIVYVAWRVQQPPFAPWADEAFLLVEFLFLASSRDNLRKYYARTLRLFGSPSLSPRRLRHDQRQPPPEARKQKTPGGKAGHGQKIDEEVDVAA